MRTNAKRLAWLCIGLMALGLTACTPAKPGGTRPTTSRIHPVVFEASALARNHDTLGGQAQRDNAAAIERLVAGLDNATLGIEAAKLAEGDPLYNFMGRELQRRGLDLPRPFDREGQWRFNAGNRPAADRDGYRPPRKLAVLLPLTGNLATAASPVRDGLLAGYYGEHRTRPQIAFYDTAGTPSGAVEAYRKAAADGADYVLGPLGRDEVGALFQQDALDVPVLALNRGPQPPPSGNASFALAPEDDGIAAAEYLLSRKARRVLVLQGGDDNLRRSTTAFRDHLASRGGTVVETLTIAEKPVDSIAALQAATQKEGGVDAVFISLKAPQARALTPQLLMAGLGDTLRVGTSQLLSGTGKPEQDKALDGIAFPAETWTVQGLRGLPPAEATGNSLMTARGPAAKLFAFGYDAWLLTAYLEKLANDANGKVDGATGDLRLDGFGNVLRTPAWSTFSNGQIVSLGRSGG
ncbi:MAG: penicillin-binding protein activator [Lysobacter sp.]|nr:penicillin-binding protein activator [Lysobacter sp.]